MLVDGVVKATTDANGSYKLTQMTSGVFTISASKEHTIFKTLKQIKISSTNPQLEDIVVERFELWFCHAASYLKQYLILKKYLISLRNVL